MATVERSILLLGSESWHDEVLPVIGDGYPPEEAKHFYRLGISKPTALLDAQRLVRDLEFVSKLYVIVVHTDVEHGQEFATAMLTHLTSAGYKLEHVIMYCHENQTVGDLPGRLETVINPLELRELLHHTLRRVLDHEEPFRNSL